jgi:phosphate acetyltransferase
MSLVDIIKQKAKKFSKSIIYPEGEDARIITAAINAIKQGIIKKAGLIGNISKIKQIAKNLKLELLDKIEIFDPASKEQQERIAKFTEIFYETRKFKGITKDEARETVKKNLYFACLCVKVGLYDGFVGGATNTTGDTIRATLLTLGLKPNNKTLSSFFIMGTKTNYGNNGLFLFADCGVIPDPSSAKIVDITKNTRDSYVALFEEEPICALLSYSTKGSAEGDSVIKMREALDILHEKYPEIKVEGELQADAAIIANVARLKAPNSELAGKANILIFPDLASGNICYKLVERLSGATAIGPIFAGLNYPANDLSRGCSIDDIVSVSAATVLQSTIEY